MNVAAVNMFSQHDYRGKYGALSHRLTVR